MNPDSNFNKIEMAVKNDKLVKISIRISDSLRKEMEIEKERQDYSWSQLIISLWRARERADTGFSPHEVAVLRLAVEVLNGEMVSPELAGLIELMIQNRGLA